jgi:hypothetical protein
LAGFPPFTPRKPWVIAMSHANFSTLDLEDLTPKQLRKLLGGFAMRHLTPKEKEEAKKDSEEDADKENDDLVDLHEEKKGDSKPPKVTKGDLPPGLKIAADKEDKKDKKKNG